MRRRREGFTMVELMVVIAIIAVLIGLVLVGLNAYQRRINERDTRATLQSLVAILKENERNLPTLPVLPNPLSLSNVVSGGPDRQGPAVQRTRNVMARLLAVPANKTAIGNFPADKLFTFSLGANDVNAKVPVVLDAWGNPIILVPGPNPAQPAGINNGGIRVTVKKQVRFIHSPNDRPFWASAGPDGDFSTGDDNLYSFDN